MTIRKMTCRSDTLPPAVLTAREHQEMRRCIERVRRLGIKDNRLTNLVDRMSVTLKKGARRAQKSATTKERAIGGVVDRQKINNLNTGVYVQKSKAMKFEATFSEHGRVMTRTYNKPDATKEDVIEWFGLRESDIDWFRIKQINED